MERPTKLLLTVLTTFFFVNIASTCSVQGMSTTNWWLDLDVIDTDRGEFLRRTTTDIVGIQSATHSGEGLNSGPYFVASVENSEFMLLLHENFAQYEENETLNTMSIAVVFTCTNGQTLSHSFFVNIIDTNNNDPIFTTGETITFTVTPPLPPGYQLTSLVNRLIARDIDLTTQRINFDIEENVYFEIQYDSSTSSKNFDAVVRTKSFIRSLSEPVNLRISATDVDQTGDPPRTTYANLVIEADGEFVFPEELIFSQVFYLATYTSENEVSLQNPIYLQQGYDELVTFNITGEYNEYFALIGEENLSVGVLTPLPADVIRLGTILIELRASRKYTSGATATLVLQLPEVLTLEFAAEHYDGTIIDNTLTLSTLTLTQGYENGFTISFGSVYSTYFDSSIANNIVTVTMTSLPVNIIEANTYITVPVIATSDTSSARTILVLEIIKDDVTTPLFQEPLYTGRYDVSTGLSLNSIVLIQGFDQTVQFDMDGEHASYFNLLQVDNSNVLSLQVISTLPEQILQDEHHILLNVVATKPRTVGANTVISIALPSARSLSFEQPSYTGSVEGDIITIPAIRLSLGYADDVTFDLTGEYANFFKKTNNENEVIIILSTPLTESVIMNNDIITLSLEAVGSNTVSARTNIVLQIVKEDANTPVFSDHIYYGEFQDTEVSVTDISLSQGYDGTVEFALVGEHASYFILTQNDNNVTVSSQSSIPEEIVYNVKVLVFNIVANKPLTVGASSAIAITFPQELTEATIMKFSETINVGALENNVLALENIVLQTGYTLNTEFILTGEHRAYFSHTNNGNEITVSLASPLPPQIVENNKFILLSLEAVRERAVSTSTAIVIEIIREDISVPVFSAAYYQGSYTAEGALQIEGTITLEQGYDDTVEFDLDGALSEWFSLDVGENEVSVVLDSSLPEQVVQNYNQLLFTIVANKPNTIAGKTAISIDLPREVSPVVLRFSQSSYVGSIENGTLQLEPITLLGEYNDNVNFTIDGEYNNFFSLDRDGNTLLLSLSDDLPDEAINNNIFILLDIEVFRPDAISGFSTIVIEIIKQQTTIEPLIFDRTFYTGSYVPGELTVTYQIQLAQGYDDTVQFSLGDEPDSQWFSITPNGNGLTLSTIDENLSEVSDRSHLVFTVVANKPGTLPGSATVVISLTGTSASVLRFSQIYYTGSIEDGSLTLEPITIEEGYSEDVNFSLDGPDYLQYFNLTLENGVVTVTLGSELPTDITDTVNVMVLTVEARSVSSVANATLVIELVRNVDTEIRPLLFEEAHYSGSYSEIGGLAFDHEIRLIDHFDDDVDFTLDGAYAENFSIQRSNNSVTITANQLPSDVLLNNDYLLLSILARKNGFIDGKAAIVISLTDDFSSPTVLRFEQNHYTGQIQNNEVILDNIVISEGYSSDTTFNFQLRGDLDQYFRIESDGAAVFLILQSQIPDNILDDNTLVVLDLEVSALQALSAYTTIILETGSMVENLMFAEPYYTGIYKDEKLEFENIISLGQGYNADVVFNLEEGYENWFSLERNNGNSLTVILINTIPYEVLLNNHNLIFTITASHPDHLTAKTSIIISLENDLSNISLLRFDQINYRGSIQNSDLDLERVTISEGFSDNVTLALTGALNTYFSVSQGSAIVSIELTTEIPDDLIPDNRLVILTLEASAQQTLSAYATIIIEISATINETEFIPLIFGQSFYVGDYTEESGLAFENTISLSHGYDTSVEFLLEGGHSEFFNLNQDGNSAELTLLNPIPSSVLANNQHLTLVVKALRSDNNIARATIIITLTFDSTAATVLRFNSINYRGQFENQQVILEPMILSEGYSDAVSFTLQGELSNYFDTTNAGSTVTLITVNLIPEDILADRNYLVVDIAASAQQAISAFASIILTVPNTEKEVAAPPVFSQTHYIGNYHSEDGLKFDTQITVQQGYDDTVRFALDGELNTYFSVSQGSAIVSIELTTEIPDDLIPDNRLVILTLEASAQQTLSAYATIIIEISATINETEFIPLIFGQSFYVGDYTEENGLAFENTISLSHGYDTSVEFLLEGGHSEFFNLNQDGNSAELTLLNPIPSSVLANNQHLTLVVRALRSDNNIARATIIITLTFDSTAATVLRFNSINYRGQFENQQVILEPMILSEGYSDAVSFTLQGELSNYFDTTNAGSTVTLITVNPISEDILADRNYLVVDITASAPQAISAFASIILNVPNTEEVAAPPVFSQTYYIGNYHPEDGLSFDTEITLQQGFDVTVQFALDGDNGWFRLEENGINLVVIIPSDEIPGSDLPHYLSFSVTATKPGTTTAAAAIFVLVQHDSPSNPDGAAFDKALYLGIYEQGQVRHDTISLSDHDGSTIEIYGEYKELFDAQVTSGSVLVQAAGSTPLPEDTTHVALELRAGEARTALILDVTKGEVTEPPTVTFSASSYQIRADVSQTGLIGRVQATADNNERLQYSLVTDNAHLTERLSVSDEGDLHLFAPANSGVYSFNVAAMTLNTLVSASAMVHLTVDAISVCGDDDRVLPPLIILNRDEEETHDQLVVLDGTLWAGCWFSLSNHWPLDHDWLFVNETGLHAKAIDREHPSIAFMALSQIQAELILHCDSDDSTVSRMKRSLNTRLDWLGPYEYGNNKWVLTDTITYNSRRSFVNLIVDDINDNDPIFEGKEDEPIAVGYPVPELIDVIMPRALVELKATDADMGENAALLYWSTAPQLAVSPTRGTVHVRDNERSLEEGMTFVVQATDRNGAGNTGSIELVLRLLDLEHIAVITVRDAFLDDEAIILDNITTAIGYEVRVLTSVVISDEYETETEASRMKRQVEEARGASLQLYVYGLVQKNPVDVSQLTSDINSNLMGSALVADSVSLQDYLDSREICDSGRDIGLLVATILLSILLFIIIVLAAIWYFLNWRKDRNYDSFSDENSLASRNNSVEALPKPETLTRPRLDIDELKRSERRLQEMLDAPISNVIIEPTSSRNTGFADTKINVPVSKPIIPIVIQSRDKLKTAAQSDDEDEFGEIKTRTGRKSVVTFNEVVEKIIHDDGRPDSPDSSPDYEVERL